jgi:MoxR-like ATPase
VTATREDQGLRLGASPRAAIQLLRAAKALAAMDGRDHVLPDDVQLLAAPVLAHRLLLNADAALGRRTAEQVVAELLTIVPVPRGR